MAEEFFRRIENPNGIRRKVLESSKELIQNLKSHQKILEIRKNKTETMKALKIELKEINLLLDKLRDSFPSDLVNKFESERKEKPIKKTSSSKKGEKKKVLVKKKIAEPSELVKLENKLSDIESKLKNLG